MPLNWTDAPTGQSSDLARCRALLRTGSRTFYAASFLLPRRVRDPASALYAFCRLADDAVDLGDCAEEAIEILKSRVAQAYDGHPQDHPADRAFAHTVANFDVPRELPEALLEGFAWDASGQRYETLEDLHAYAARVAGTVGVMMALFMGVRRAEPLARACDLGIAMQLTNIARDVGEDAAAGRLYLPLSWLREAGIDPDRWLAEPASTAAIRSVTRRLLDAAETLYQRADVGIAALPADCRPGIGAARLIYAEIGREIARAEHDSMSSRAVVSGRRKVLLLARAAGRVVPYTKPAGDPAALGAAQYLVDAALAVGNPHRIATSLPWWDAAGRAVRFVELISAFEARERMARQQKRPSSSPVLNDANAWE